MANSPVILDAREFWRKYHFSTYPPNIKTPWCKSDTEQLFDRLQKNPVYGPMLADMGWDKNSVEYRFNNYGFRTDDDFDINNPTPGAMFLGCSFTTGIGLNIEDTWSHKVHTIIGGTFYNLGQGGAGFETYYRLLRAWAPVLKPFAVYTLGSFEPRRELLSDKGVDWFSVTSNEETEVFKRWFSSGAETEISRHRTFDAIRWVCKENNIPLYAPPRELYTQAIHLAKDTAARDLKHPGAPFHTHLANHLKEWDKLV